MFTISSHHPSDDDKIHLRDDKSLSLQQQQIEFTEKCEKISGENVAQPFTNVANRITLLETLSNRRDLRNFLVLTGILNGAKKSKHYYYFLIYTIWYYFVRISFLLLLFFIPGRILESEGDSNIWAVIVRATILGSQGIFLVPTVLCIDRDLDQHCNDVDAKRELKYYVHWLPYMYLFLVLILNLSVSIFITTLISAPLRITWYALPAMIGEIGLCLQLTAAFLFILVELTVMRDMADKIKQDVQRNLQKPLDFFLWQDKFENRMSRTFWANSSMALLCLMNLIALALSPLMLSSLDRAEFITYDFAVIKEFIIFVVIAKYACNLNETFDNNISITLNHLKQTVIDKQDQVREQELMIILTSSQRKPYAYKLLGFSITFRKVFLFSISSLFTFVVGIIKARYEST